MLEVQPQFPETIAICQTNSLQEEKCVISSV